MKFLAIDGNSVLNRAYYGIKSLTNKEGQATNAIYGFLNILLKLIDDINPQFVAIAFDVKAPTFRSEQYKEYKAARKPTPDDLVSQMKITKDIIKAMGYAVIEKPGFEADDILGTLAYIAKKVDNMECIIATGDKDSLQLVDDKVIVRIMSTKFGSPVTVEYNKNVIAERYGINPKQLIDIKALMGDTSDNIPGVSGVGEKTAINLISKYSNIENIYENLSTIDEKQSLKNKLHNDKELAFLSKDLATICTCVPIDLNIESYKIKGIDKEKLVRLLTDLEIFSIIKRLKLNNSSFEYKKGDISINDQLTFKEVIKEKMITINSKFNNDLSDKLNNIVNDPIYLICKSGSCILLIDNEVVIDSDENKVFKIIFEFFERNKKIKLFVHDSKYFHHKMFELNCESMPVYFDTLIAGYLLKPESNSYEISRLINIYCKVPISDDWENNITVFSKLCDIMESELKNNGMWPLFKNIEMPLSLVLSDMELRGFRIDKKGLELFGSELDELIKNLENQIYVISRCEFNINSPKQLAKVLFEDLMLPTGRKIKTGYSTNSDVLDFLRDKHPIIDKILEYRLLTKLKTTYVNGLLKQVREDGRIHSIFNQTETKTGRISSEQPNMQNIPIKTSIGSRLRKYFQASEGCKLIDGDYSQIELRILADMSNDENMIEAFNNDEDIHSKTAAEIFGVSLSEVTAEMRSLSKAVNFGIIYGISAFSLSQDIGVSVSEASNYINLYFEKFKGVKIYLDKLINDAKENGFVTTLFGRKRNIPELSSKNKNIRSFGERVARNTPIQGTAADIIKIAMVNVYHKLKEKNLKSKLILQVHDELIIEAPNDEAEEAKNILKTEMQKAITLRILLKADINVGYNWLDNHN